MLRPARMHRRKAHKSFEHDLAQDPAGGGIPDMTYPHLGKRNLGHVEKPPSAVPANVRGGKGEIVRILVVVWAIFLVHVL